MATGSSRTGILEPGDIAGHWTLPVNRGSLIGSADGRTRLVPKVAPSMDGSGAMIRTANWGGSNLATMPVLRDICVDGNGVGQEVDSFPFVTQADKTAFPALYHAIQLGANAPKLENVEINNIPGEGLRLRRRGYVSGFTTDNTHNKKRAGDQEEGHIGYVRVNRCYTGVVVEEGWADGIIDVLSISACRDDGLRDESGSLDIGYCHPYGMDRGVIFGGGPNAGPSRCDNMEPENCRIGFSCLANANGSYIGNLHGYECSETVADLQAQIKIGVADLIATENNTYAFKIGNTGSVIPVLTVNATAAVNVIACQYYNFCQKSQMPIAVYNGPAGSNTDIAIKIGNDCYNNQQSGFMYGFETGLDLRDWREGYGNSFRFKTDTVPQSVLWPEVSDGRANFLAANELLINGAIPT